MKKFSFFLMLCSLFFFSAKSEENKNLFESKKIKIKIDEKLVWQALGEGVENAGEFIQEGKLEHNDKKEKKRKKRRFFKRLLKTVINLATKLAAKEIMEKISPRSRANDVKHTVVQVCHELYELVNVENRKSVFLLKDKVERERAIYEKLNSSDQVKTKFIQELFSELFDCFSEKLEVINRYFCSQVLQKFEKLSESKSVQDVSNENICRVCYKVASHAVEKSTFKTVCDEKSLNIPAILCFVRIIADIGDLVYGSEKNPTEASDNKESFLKRAITLIHELYEFLSSDDLLATLKKLSTFLEKLDSAQTEQEWAETIETFFNKTEDGIAFLKEVFSNLRIYLKAKLAEIFSDLFYNLSVAISD